MWSYLRQYHPKKSDLLAAQVIEEGRRAFEQRDEAWNIQLKLMLSNVCSHMKIDLTTFSPMDNVDPRTCPLQFLALVQDWLLARASCAAPPPLDDDLCIVFPVQSSKSVAAAAAAASTSRSPPRIRGSSSSVALATAAATGVEPFPLLTLMRTLKRRDADWPPEVCRGIASACVLVTRHTSHVTRHTSHVTRHTSHVTRHATRLRSAIY